MELKRKLAVLLSVAIAVGSVPIIAFAESGSDGLCPHHTEHTEECRYAEPTDGMKCTHEHTEKCYEEMLICLDESHEHDDGCYENVLNCIHEHGEDCGYREGAEGSPCEYECKICAVQELINALPSAEELRKMTLEDKQEAYIRIQDAYNAYLMLSDDEKVQIDKANEVFGVLFELFNSMTATTDGTVYVIDKSYRCDTVNTDTVNLTKYLPKDAKVTSMSVSADTSIISETSPSWTKDSNDASLRFTTRETTEPTNGKIVVTIKTSKGDITVTINVNLTGKYIVNISAFQQNALYDGNTHAGYTNVSGTLTSGKAYTGKYTYTYKKSDGTPLAGAPSVVGSYNVTISIPKDNENYKGSLTLSFDIITEAEATYQVEETGKWQSGSFAEALANVYDGGTVKLLKDINLSAAALVAKNVTITSENADSLKKITSTKNEHGYLIYVTADVTMENVVIDGGSENNITASRALIAVGNGTNAGKLTLGKGAVVQNNNNITTNGAGGGVCVLLGNMIIDGGKITGNKAYVGGGVAVMNESCNVIMNSGEISENSATSAENLGGGGVYVREGSFAMKNGSIKNNTSAHNGGGVYVYSGDESANAVFRMENGEITENNAANVGGGIFVDLYATLELVGGSVTDNSTSNFAGGIECSPFSNIKISGNPVIKGNTSKEETDGGLYPDGHPNYGYSNITLGELGETADINFYTYLGKQMGTGFIIARPVAGYTITTDDISRLSYEDGEHYLKLDDDGNVALTKDVLYYVSFNSNGGTAVASQVIGSGQTATKPSNPTKTNYNFKGWYTNEDCTTEYSFETVVTDNIILYAGWSKISGTSSGGSSSKKYSVITDNTENGSIKSSTERAAAGRIVTITVTPDDGYEINNVMVTDANGKEIKITDKGDGKYTFVMPASKVEIRAEFVETDAAENGTEKTGYENENNELPLVDVNENDWFSEAVEFVYDNGIMSGTGEGQFSPYLATTRGMIAAVFYNISGESYPDEKTIFPDVKVGQYYNPAVAWGADSHVMSGYDDGLFRPEKTISREEFALLIYNYAKYKGMDVSNIEGMAVHEFTDWQDISDWSMTAVRYCLNAGIMSGRDDGSFDPQGKATRAEAASMIMRLMESMQ